MILVSVVSIQRGHIMTFTITKEHVLFVVIITMLLIVGSIENV